MTEAQRLRAEFDRSFMEPPAFRASSFDSYLLVEAGERTIALHAAEVRSVEPAMRIVPLPSAAPAFLGVVGLRGRVVPVFSLGLLLGQAAESIAERASEQTFVVTELLQEATGMQAEPAVLTLARVLHFLRQPRTDHAAAHTVVEYLSRRYDVVSMSSLFALESREQNVASSGRTFDGAL